MHALAIIPARYGSSRFPGKPLAMIAGKPMIQWVYELAKQVAELQEVYVATDDHRIAECVQSFGGQAIMTHGGHASGSDRLAEAADILDLPPEAIIVNIQGDQVVFAPPVIAELITLLKADPRADLATPIRGFTDAATARNPNVVKVVFDRQHYALYFSRAPIPHYRDEGGTPCYFKHIGIYAYRRDFLPRFVQLPPGVWEAAEKLEQLRALEFGFKIKVVETEWETVEVDDPADAPRAEAYLLRAS
ncbi:MAG: 3-deoxy-manno-octulosonate cytidylyltransferase [Deltaproteobacteria bacterium]|nr:3-deoxy-manno-octulosonate cytidylyltransferase [Deltaproteobacteria bacterium]